MRVICRTWTQLPVSVAAYRAMDEAGVCELTLRRIKQDGDKPGALWHIFDPEDADKIRDLLNKVSKVVDKRDKISNLYSANKSMCNTYFMCSVCSHCTTECLLVLYVLSVQTTLVTQILSF